MDRAKYIICQYELGKDIWFVVIQHTNTKTVVVGRTENRVDALHLILKAEGIYLKELQDNI